jgi:hypothetical protein
MRVPPPAEGRDGKRSEWVREMKREHIGFEEI